MHRVMTLPDLSHEEEYSFKRNRSFASPDPLGDPSIPMPEKQRLASLWEVIKSNKQNQDRLQELLGPLMVQQATTSASSTMQKQPLPLSSGLQIACLYGDLNLVKVLVSRGEKIDEVTMSPDNFGRGRCPMSVAVELGHHQILQYLIGCGGDVSNVHDPPLNQAVKRGDLTACKMLVQSGADPDPIMHQLLWPKCNVETVKMLLEAGASPSATMLLTPLWRGCGADLIKLLLDWGAPVRSDLENESALEVAICRGAQPQVINVLLASNANWKAKNHSLYPKAFRRRTMQLMMVNQRFGNLLPTKVMTAIISWLAIAEKRQGDTVDLRSAICGALSRQDIDTRLGIFGWKYGTSSSKMEALAPLSEEQLTKILFYRAPSPASPAVGVLRKSSSRSRMAMEGDVVHTKPKQAKRTKVNQTRRLAQHPVADANNPNSPKPHHCTCCHVCHVSMKQRPRPTAACSQCNTIICKLCLQDRWKTDQWEEACNTQDWVCHKCRSICVCKSCKAKGSRLQQGKYSHH